MELENNQEYVKLGDKFKDNEKYQDAIVAYEKVISSEINCASLLCNLGKCYFKIKDFDKGSYYFIEALKVDSNNIFALHNLSYYFIKSKKYFDAKPLCKLLIETNNMLNFLVKDLIKMAKINGDFDFLKYIMANCEHAITPYKKLNFYISECQYKKAEEFIKNYLNDFVIPPHDYFKLKYMLVRIYTLANKFNEAKDILVEIHQINDNIKLFLYEATEYSIKSQDIKFAIDIIEDILKNHPHDLDCHLHLIKIYEAVSNEDLKDKAIKKVIDICKLNLSSSCKY